MDSVKSFLVSNPTAEATLRSAYDPTYFFDADAIISLVPSLADNLSVANTIADNMQELFAGTKVSVSHLASFNEEGVDEISSVDFGAPVPPAVIVYQRLSPETKIVYDKLAELGKSVQFIYDHIHLLCKELQTTPGDWVPGYEVKNVGQELNRFNVTVPKARLGYIFFQDLMRRRIPEQRHVSNGTVEIKRNNVVLKFGGEGLLGDNTPADIDAFCSGIKCGPLGIEYVDHPDSVKLMRMLTTHYTFNVSVKDRITVVTHTQSPINLGLVRAYRLAKIMDLLDPELPKLRHVGSSVLAVLNSIQLWLIDNWHLVQELYNSASRIDTGKVEEIALMEAARLPTVNSYQDAIQAFKLHDKPDHRLRNANGMHVLNSCNGGGFDSLYETKYPVLLECAVRTINRFAKAMGNTDEQWSAIGETPQNVYALKDAMSGVGRTIANESLEKANALTELTRQSMENKVVFDIREGSSHGFERLGQFADVSSEKLPHVYAFFGFGKHLPDNQNDFLKTIAECPFSQVVIFKPPGYHNSQLLVMLLKYPQKYFGRKTPLEGAKIFDVPVPSPDGKTYERIYVPGDRMVVKMTPAIAKNEIFSAFVNISRVSQYCEHIVFKHYSNAVRPRPEAFVLPKFLIENGFWATHSIAVPPEGIRYRVYVRQARVEQGPEELFEPTPLNLDL